MASRETTVVVDTAQPGIQLVRLEDNDDDEDEEKLKFQNSCEEDSNASNSPITSRRAPEQRPFFKKSTDKTVESPFVSNDLSNRWGALVCLASLNFACTFSWASAGAGAEYFNKFYDLDVAASWFSMVYTMFLIPASIIIVLAEAFFGVRFSAITSAVLVAVSCIFKVPFDFLPISSHLRFAIQLLSHCFTAIVYPAATILPLKFVLRWFPQDHKVFAAGATFLANLSAILIANLLTGSTTNLNIMVTSSVPYYNVLTGLLNLMIGGLSILVLTKVLNKDVCQDGNSILEDLKKFTDKRAIGVALALGANLAVFNVILSTLSPLLCSAGHERVYTSAAAATFIIGGVSGVMFAGLIVDFTKRQDECFKFGSGLCVIAQLLFFQLVLHKQNRHLVIISIAFLGELLLGLVPVGLAVMVRRLKSEAETISVAIVLILGQFLSLLYLMLISSYNDDISPSRPDIAIVKKNCEAYGHAAKDWTLSVTVVSVLSTVILIALFFLDRKEKRKASEESVQAQSASTQTNAEEVETAMDTTTVHTVKP
ncbi:unnamed protein product [Bursaphelenchus okinawaensis]|uniref:MFS domain-containing protein n=1 Tax=Bursaphelenchus okinawaensis TaxID=465554 RepID=A0A811LJI8_9BILA|nr:unnamed protein product [Bursaphelenchus okinawaensis]CAG9123613.1 unnamed protein product [Bursaphelenchus okinawaensis]